MRYLVNSNLNSSIMELRLLNSSSYSYSEYSYWLRYGFLEYTDGELPNHEGKSEDR